jgi:4-hydroxy-tetrahydrodipicolinate synthase
MPQYDVFPTMITPYLADGTVDYATAEKYVDWYFQKGCTGIFAICQSSEIFYLSLSERIASAFSSSKFCTQPSL